MIFIFEGFDKTGKTSILKKVMERYPKAFYYHPTRPSKNEFDSDFTSLITGENLLMLKLIPFINGLSKGNPIFFDRSFLSDIVYPKINLDLDKNKVYEQYYKFIADSVVFLLFCANPITILQRIQSDKKGIDSNYSFDKIKAFIFEYEKFLSESPFKFIKYDTTYNGANANADIVYLDIMSILEEEK
ncbi:hypothetical protein M0R19_06140 [Candidatus Pacearchaeota archaeon]|jgi:thymidylate kinase|nr:hypothetical protein [Candidatus Pacearchaeota archaeon]